MRASAIGSLGLLPLTLVALVAAGCTSHADNASTAAGPIAAEQTPDEKPVETPEEKPDEKPVDPPKVETQINVTVASVQLFEDCPSPKKKAAAEPDAVPAKPASMAKPARGARAKRKPGGAPLRQPCTQSNAQLSVTSKQEAPAKVELTAVRIRLADGKKSLSEVPFRDPQVWADQQYNDWDGAVAPQAEVKASYSLGLPDWSAVEKAVGGSSFGPMYVLEFDVTIDGEQRTLESTATPRERSARVVT